MKEPATPTDPAAHWAEHAGRYARLLFRSAEVTAELIEQAGSATTPKEADRPDPALINAALAACDKGCRNLRQNAMLANLLADGANPRQPAPDPAKQAAARRQILRAVEDDLQLPRNLTPAQRAGLRAELHERLESPELTEELETADPLDIAKEIAHDLGLHGGGRPHRRRTPADIAELHARAAGRPTETPERTPAPAAPPEPEPEPDHPAPFEPPDLDLSKLDDAALDRLLAEEAAKQRPNAPKDG